MCCSSCLRLVKEACCCVRRATPPSRTAVVHEISQRGADAFIFGEGCAGLARRRTSRADPLPPNCRRATPPIYPDLIYDRHSITLPSTQRETSTRRKSVLATARKSFAGWSEIELRRRERIKPTLLLVQNGHGAMSDLIPLCGQKRTLPTRTDMLKRKAGGEPGCQKTALSS